MRLTDERPSDVNNRFLNPPTLYMMIDGVRVISKGKDNHRNCSFHPYL